MKPAPNHSVDMHTNHTSVFLSRRVSKHHKASEIMWLEFGLGPSGVDTSEARRVSSGRTQKKNTCFCVGRHRFFASLKYFLLRVCLPSPRCQTGSLPARQVKWWPAGHFPHLGPLNTWGTNKCSPRFLTASFKYNYHDSYKRILIILLLENL